MTGVQSCVLYSTYWLSTSNIRGVCPASDTPASRTREKRRAAAMASRPRRLLLLACCACTCSGFDFFSGFGGGGMPGGMQGGGTPDREYYDLLGVEPC